MYMIGSGLARQTAARARRAIVQRRRRGGMEILRAAAADDADLVAAVVGRTHSLCSTQHFKTTLLSS